MRRAFTLVEALVCLAIIAILALILFPVFNRGHRGDGERGWNCQSNLKQIGLAFIQYSQDAEGKFPTDSVVWGHAIQPYLKSYHLFHCPSATGWSDEQTTDYYTNGRLAGISIGKYESALAILMGEGLGGQPLDYSLKQLPASWAQSSSPTPAERHLDKANYLFADGHVKRLKPEEVTLQPPSKNQPTFLVKS